MNTTGSPSLAAASAMLSPDGRCSGASSSMMVTVAVPLARTAPPGLLSLTVKLSAGSGSVSSVVATVIVAAL